MTIILTLYIGFSFHIQRFIAYMEKSSFHKYMVRFQYAQSLFFSSSTDLTDKDHEGCLENRTTTRRFRAPNLIATWPTKNTTVVPCRKQNINSPFQSIPPEWYLLWFVLLILFVCFYFCFRLFCFLFVSCWNINFQV